MVAITVADAVKLVRKNLDELDPNGSIMMDDENGSSAEYGDNPSLNDIIARNLPEAINAVHLAAPVWLLEGETAALATNTPTHIYNYYDATMTSDTYGMLHLQMADDAKFLRLVSFQATDSPIIVTDVIAEASPEGRKQLNKYLRGQYDRPRLVQLQGVHSSPAFNYFTLLPSTVSADPAPSFSDFIKQFIYIKEQFYSDTATEYQISRRLRQNIIDCLTAMVLMTYSDQRAQSFYQKANSFTTL